MKLGAAKTAPINVPANGMIQNSKSKTQIELDRIRISNFGFQMLNFQLPTLLSALTPMQVRHAYGFESPSQNAGWRETEKITGEFRFTLLLLCGFKNQYTLKKEKGTELPYA